MSDNVETGSVFEVARMDLPEGVRRLTVPKSARLVPEAPPGVVFVATKKSMHFGGHPPEPMPLEGLRANLGCATKHDRDVLLLGTFGEFSTKEGGVELEIVVLAPRCVTVQRRANLEGPESVAGREQGPRVGYWYGPTAPTQGWQRVALELDPRQLASAP